MSLAAFAVAAVSAGVFAAVSRWGDALVMLTLMVLTCAADVAKGRGAR